MLKELLMSDHGSKRNKFSLKQNHKGFAISIEILLTMVMFTQITAFTFYSIRVMNGQRFLSTILYNSAVQASKWGGNDTKAWHSATGYAQTISTFYSNKISSSYKQFNPTLTITPDKITDNNVEITTTLSYSWPSFFKSGAIVNSGNVKVDNSTWMNKRVTQTVKINSIMNPGKLL